MPTREDAAHTPLSTATRAAAAAVALVMVGCAHYRLGADPKHTATDRDLTVATVAVPASAGVDGARLTRELVDALRERGFEGATWRADGSTDADVRCVVDGPPTRAFRGHHRAELRARCAVEFRRKIARIRGVGQQTAVASREGRSELATTQNTALESAASDAIADAATKIARTLRDARD